MEVKLYDTLTREVKPLKAVDGKSYRFYCCGPTVYGPAHIGNFRTFLVQDVFRRVLECTGMEPYHVRNLTDVDDKTIRRSQEEGLSLKEFTKKWTIKFHNDCRALNMLEPHKEPAATQHIREQIQMIQCLIERAHAYAAKDGSVYYKVSSFEEYGKLAHLDREYLKTQSENSAGDANLADEYDRESVADFVLWKAHKDEDGPNFWESPWGKGRPGWHIECSAMSRKYLGDTFDLHGGGVDLCFPHHENEIAQSEGCTGKTFCNHWFHGAHLQVEGEKMSKSLGNLFTVDDIVKKGFTPIELRYLLISGHYRQPFNFTISGLGAAKSALHKLEKLAEYLLGKAGLEKDQLNRFIKANSGVSWGVFEPAWKCICDDLNVAAALGEVFKSAKSLEDSELGSEAALSALTGLGKLLYVLGLEIFTRKAEAAPQEIVDLAQQRWDAKQGKDYAEADRLRGEVEAKGWKIFDRKDGFSVEKV